MCVVDECVCMSRRLRVAQRPHARHGDGVNSVHRLCYFGAQPAVNREAQEDRQTRSEPCSSGASLPPPASSGVAVAILREHDPVCLHHAARQCQPIPHRRLCGPVGSRPQNGGGAHPGLRRRQPRSAAHCLQPRGPPGLARRCVIATFSH